MINLAKMMAGGVSHVIDLARGLKRPTGVFAVAGDGSARVFWNDTRSSGETFVATASTGQTATGVASPIVVPGLPNGAPVTFTIARRSMISWNSNPVTPTAGDPGVIYYVDSFAGSDQAAGTSTTTPLRSLSAAMAKPLGAGDAVLLKRGSTWVRETFGAPTASGAQNRPIVLAAYGRGADPYLHGGEAIVGWESYPSGAGSTYRAPLGRLTGSYPGVIYRNGIHRLKGSSATTLSNGEWFFDGMYMYLRQDGSNPASDDAVYEVASTLDAFASDGRSDWVVRDLHFELYNRHAVSAANGSRFTMQENVARRVGCQTFYTGTPSNVNGVFNLGIFSDGVFRGNDVRNCHTDFFYGVVVQNTTIIDNVGVLATGEAADCLQLDQGGASTPSLNPQAFGCYIARNDFDQTGTPGPKGCIIVFVNGGVIERNKVRGGNFGISAAGADLEVGHNDIRDIGIEQNTDWAGGLYSDTGTGAGNATSGGFWHHNLIVNCMNGIALNNGLRGGYRFQYNTIVGSVKENFHKYAITWDSANSSSLDHNLAYSPAAALGDVLPASSTGFTVSGNIVGIDPLFIDTVDYVPLPGRPAAAVGYAVP